jgi:hypothetical protein
VRSSDQSRRARSRHHGRLLPLTRGHETMAAKQSRSAEAMPYRSDVATSAIVFVGFRVSKRWSGWCWLRSGAAGTTRGRVRRHRVHRARRLAGHRRSGPPADGQRRPDNLHAARQAAGVPGCASWALDGPVAAAGVRRSHRPRPAVRRRRPHLPAGRARGAGRRPTRQVRALHTAPHHLMWVAAHECEAYVTAFRTAEVEIAARARQAVLFVAEAFTAPYRWCSVHTATQRRRPPGRLVHQSATPGRPNGGVRSLDRQSTPRRATGRVRHRRPYPPRRYRSDPPVGCASPGDGVGRGG